MRPQHVATLVVALALTWTAPGYTQQTAEELYQAGLYQEEVQGDLERAIASYEGILKDHPESRAVGAKAQLHIGLCYEMLGLSEAQRAYQRVIDDYAEHRDEVTVARQRLASLSRALAELSREPMFRKIEIASKPQNGVLSPDGRELAFVSEGGVWVVPLQGNVDPDIAGEPVLIAEVEGVWGNYGVLAWSADGEWIAVNGEAEASSEGSVHVVPAGGGEPRVLPMPPRGGHVYSYRVSLSPDGQTLAFSALELGSRQESPETHNRYIYVAPVAGGDPEQLTIAWSVLPAFSPDGERVAYVGYRERDDWQEDTGRSRFDGDLWVVPSVGGTAVKLAHVDGRLRGPVWSPDGKYIAAHHERGEDNDSKEVWVFPLSVDGSSAGDPIRIALPRSSWEMAAGWTPDDELGVFIASESHSAVYTVPAHGGKAVQVTPEGEHNYPRWSSDGDRIYLRSWDGDGVTMEYVAAAGGDLVEVPVRSERPLVSRIPGGGHSVSPDGRRIVVSAYQEPYDSKEGVDVWTIPLDGGRPTRLTNDGSFEGYPCWSPDGQWIAFTDEPAEEAFHAIFLIPAQGGEIRQLSVESDSVGGGAIAFSPDGERIAFFSNGTIKTVPVQGGEPEVLLNEVRSSWHSDLAWSPDGEEIAYSIGGAIWVASVDGSQRAELRTSLPENAKHGDFSWSPDGERIAFVTLIGGEAEFWLISKFLP
jgi:Tol biopolymer transport system component